MSMMLQLHMCRHRVHEIGYVLELGIRCRVNKLLLGLLRTQALSRLHDPAPTAQIFTTRRPLCEGRDGMYFICYCYKSSLLKRGESKAMRSIALIPPNQ